MVLWTNTTIQQYRRVPDFYIATLLAIVMKDPRSFIVNSSLQTTPRTPSYLSAH
jgi:hypothetical protein